MPVWNNKNQKLPNDEFYNCIKEWIAEESNTLVLGVLATVNENKPYTRTIVIKEINKKGVLFFTQKDSKKVRHIEVENQVSLTVLLSEKKRQITFRGQVKPLSNDENIEYWKTYPRESQIRFMVYGPTSGQIIANNSNLDQKLAEFTKIYTKSSPDKPQAYVGYRIYPDEVDFYQLNNDRISDSFTANREDNKWKILRVVP
jgi:pyridoxamine 5'-phosphate oxidase